MDVRSASGPGDGLPPAEWSAVALGVASAAVVLGIAVLRPWQAPVGADARAAWALIQQITMVVLLVTALAAPRLLGVRRPFAMYAGTAAMAAYLLSSIWINEIAGPAGLLGSTVDQRVRLVAGVVAGVALVAMVASLTRRRRTRGCDVDALIDAAVVGAAGAVAFWESLVLSLDAARLDIRIAAVAALVVATAVATFVRLLLSPSRHLASTRLLSVAFALTALPVLELTLYGMVFDRLHGHWWELPLLLACGAATAAFVHPSARQLVDVTDPAMVAPQGTVRAVILCVAVVVPAGATLVRALAAVGSTSGDDLRVILSLPTAVAGVVITLGVAWRLATLVRERESAHRLLQHRNRHDDLTGLPNRAYLIERLEQQIERVRARPDEPDAGFGLMFLDLDRFKSINDNYGHQAGDTVLVTVARRLADAVRTDDFVGRMAGDEFVLLCGQPSDEAALARLADRLRAAVEAPLPAEFGVVTPRVSIGIAAVDQTVAAASDAVSAIRRPADANMYHATRAPRSRAPAAGP